MSSTARFASASFCASRARRTTFVLGPCCGSKNGLILGAAGQDLAADHQECGRDNLFGSGRVGGWHDHQRVFNGQTPEVRPSDQRQVAGAFFQPPFKTHQRPRLAPRSRGEQKILKHPGTGARLRLGFATYYIFPIRLPGETVCR